MDPRNGDAPAGRGEGTVEAAELATPSVGTAGSGSKYLQVRPTPKTAAPRDDRMAKARRWTPWALRRAEGSRKPSKVPLAPSNTSSAWTYFHAARVSLNDQGVAGLGFQMKGEPGVVGIDLDNMLDGGKPTGVAAELLTVLAAAGGRFHVEVTPSGKGLRIFAGSTDLPFHDFLNHEHGVEVYTGESSRFLTFTGAMVPGFGAGPFDPLPAAAVEILARSAGAGKWKQGAARVDGTAPASVAASTPIPDLSRREDWPKLHPAALKRLNQAHREFLKTGAVAEKYASASEQLFAVAQALLRHLKPSQAFQILVSADGPWGVALEHRERSEERAREFLWSDLQRAAAARQKTEEERESTAASWKECHVSVTRDKDGNASAVFGVNNLANVLTLHLEWKKRIRLNEFSEVIELDGHPLAEEDIPAIAEWLRDYLRWDAEPRLDLVHKAIAVAAKAHAYNPVQERLRSLRWDGEKRLDGWLERVGCEKSEVARLVGKKWPISLVARALRPGCKCDTVLILEGPQGRRKSTLFATLVGPDYFTDAYVTLDKDGQMIMHRAWIIELSELATFKKADELRTKQFISSTTLTFRPPYGRYVVNRPRHFVLVGTTNDDEYFTDRTGNRRYWPVRVVEEKLDLEWLEANREQLLAEAVAAFDAGEKWWFDEEPEALEEARDARTEGNPLVERVRRFVREREQHEADAAKRQFTVEEVMDFYALPITNKRLVMEVAEALKEIGLKKRKTVLDGVRAWRWSRPGWLSLVADTGGGEERVQPLVRLEVGQGVGQDEKRSEIA